MNRYVSTIFWWVSTLLLLMVVDDLTFGPVFWALSLLASPEIALVVAFVVYFVAQLVLVVEGLKPNPARPAKFLLDRLNLTRKNEEIQNRDQQLRNTVTSIVIAVPAAIVIGGVLPPLLLHRIGVRRKHVLALAPVTSAIYAGEFAFLHGWTPGQLF